MSTSWQLVNIKDGSSNMERGYMDVMFRNGSLLTNPNPSAVLDQRVRKASIEDQGSNPFDITWGNIFRKLLGGKQLIELRARQIGIATKLFLDGLIASQTETSLRINLDPSEVIDSVSNMLVASTLDSIAVTVSILTQAGNVVPTTLPALQLGQGAT